MSIAELSEKLGFDSRDTAYLKETIEALVDHTVEWNILDKDKKEIWGVAALLASAEIQNGICTYGFAPHLRYKTLQPAYLYEIESPVAKPVLRTDTPSSSGNSVSTISIPLAIRARPPSSPLEKFRELMGMTPDEYPAFKALNQWVIKPAIKEINELTNFCVEVEQKREGRKIAFLKFHISHVKEVGTSEPAALYPDVEELPAVAIALVHAGVARQEALKIANQEWEAVTAEVAMENYRDFGAYIEEKIGLAKQATGVSNLAGFVIQAIRENYQDPATPVKTREAYPERTESDARSPQIREG